MRRLRSRLRRAALLALPVAACAPSTHSGSSTASSSSGGIQENSRDGGVFGYSICEQCMLQGLTCDYWGTSCIPACISCPCETVVSPVGPIDGGYPDGGLSHLICEAACPDPLYSTPPAIDLQWWVTGCGLIDGGCPPGVDAGDGGVDADGGGQCVQCQVVDCTGAGRLPEGGTVPRRVSGSLAEYLSRTAHLEAQAVVAFERMAMELRSFGAPRRLVDRVEQARLDELRHAALVGGLAEKHGGRRIAVEARTFRPRSLVAFARENAFEGCLRETFGAAAMALQAMQARDPELRAAWASIAEEEASHAELSWELASWLDGQLPASTTRRLVDELRAEVAQLAEGSFDDSSPELHQVAGLPTAAQSKKLWSVLHSEVWS